MIDVVSLPLRNYVDIKHKLQPLDPSLFIENGEVRPGLPVSVIGYPHGLRHAGMWPIWKTGHIASDFDLDYDERPMFLIDVTARKGMSGSPVVIRRSLNVWSEQQYRDADTETKLLGVYSGRLGDDSEIGIVWKPRVLQTLLERSCEVIAASLDGR
jgi:hypothetical protein